MTYSEREQIVEVLNRLFYYTDHQQWDDLKSEVLANEITMDVTSLGVPEVEKLSAQQVCDNWTAGFQGIDAIHHQPGNYIIDIDGDSAYAKAYAIASHYKKDAVNGQIREFVGSYDFHLTKGENGWRLDAFKFNLKYMAGNLDLS